MEKQELPKPKPTKKPTLAQVAMTLEALALVEMWDAQHPSIEWMDDGWVSTTVNGCRCPMPSTELLTALNKIAKRGRTIK